MKLPQISSLEELKLQKQQLRKKRLELEEQLEGNFSAVKEQLTRKPFKICLEICYRKRFQCAFPFFKWNSCFRL